MENLLKYIHYLNKSYNNWNRKRLGIYKCLAKCRRPRVPHDT